MNFCNPWACKIFLKGGGVTYKDILPVCVLTRTKFGRVEFS